MSSTDPITRSELEGLARLTRVESFNGTPSKVYLGRLEHDPTIGAALVLDLGAGEPMITSTVVNLYESSAGTVVETMNSRYLLTYLVQTAKS